MKLGQIILLSTINLLQNVSCNEINNTDILTEIKIDKTESEEDLYNETIFKEYTKKYDLKKDGNQFYFAPLVPLKSKVDDYYYPYASFSVKPGRNVTFSFASPIQTNQSNFIYSLGNEFTVAYSPFVIDILGYLSFSYQPFNVNSLISGYFKIGYSVEDEDYKQDSLKLILGGEYAAKTFLVCFDNSIHINLSGGYKPIKTKAKLISVKSVFKDNETIAESFAQDEYKELFHSTSLSVFSKNIIQDNLFVNRFNAGLRIYGALNVERNNYKYFIGSDILINFGITKLPYIETYIEIPLEYSPSISFTFKCNTLSNKKDHIRYSMLEVKGKYAKNLIYRDRYKEKYPVDSFKEDGFNPVIADISKKTFAGPAHEFNYKYEISGNAIFDEVTNANKFFQELSFNIKNTGKGTKLFTFDREGKFIQITMPDNYDEDFFNTLLKSEFKTDFMKDLFDDILKNVREALNDTVNDVAREAVNNAVRDALSNGQGFNQSPFNNFQGNR